MPLKIAARPARRLALTLALGALLASCGGGGGDPVECRVPERQVWLQSYFADNYFWADVSPKPVPGGAYATLDSYFKALLYQPGTVDKWSSYEAKASYDSFFSSGQTLGYGVFVTGVEANKVGPLYVRYVAPLSPAVTAGVKRGDRIVSVNGQDVATVVASDDYSIFTPQATGDKLTLGLADGRTVALTAAVYDLKPVDGATVVTSTGGRKVGYLMVKDMVDQVTSPLDAAFATFKSQAVSSLVIDLRYNGGGLVRVGRDLASYVRSSIPSGSTYVKLKYRADQQGRNSTYAFESKGHALNLSTVYVLAGPRTCSASEQVVNGLKPYVNVVLVGAGTCGKPWGFVPQEDSCSTIFSVVNFESVNSLDAGRYTSGFTPNCAVAEDWAKPLGTTSEPLLAAALTMADGGACPGATAIASTAVRSMLSSASTGSTTETPAPRRVFDGERPAMIP